MFVRGPLLNTMITMKGVMRGMMFRTWLKPWMPVVTFRSFWTDHEEIAFGIRACERPREIRDELLAQLAPQAHRVDREV